MKALLFILLGTLSLQANYCIQALSVSPDFQKEIIEEASSPLYHNFKDVRVKLSKPYLALRIGNYKTYKDASKEISQVRKIHHDAYIKECNFMNQNILYSKLDTPNKTENIDVVSTKAATITPQIETEKSTQTPTEIVSENTPAKIEKIVPVQTQETNRTASTQTEKIAPVQTQKATPFENLMQAYEAANKGQKSEAYPLFTQAVNESSKAFIYDQACQGVILTTPLRRKIIDDPYYVTFYATAMWYQREYKPSERNINDTLYQVKIKAGRYIDKEKKASLYLFAHIDGDTNSEAGINPIIYSDNYAGVGVGADYRITSHAHIFAELSYEDNLIQNVGESSNEVDYKAGIHYYNRWGPANSLSCSYNVITPMKWFADLYSAAILYGRYDNNIILQSSARLGLNVLTYKMSSLAAYGCFNVTADTDSIYYDNIIEVGPGVELTPYQPLPLSIRAEYRLSKYFRNLPSGEDDRFNTFLIYGIFYFEL